MSEVTFEVPTADDESLAQHVEELVRHLRTLYSPELGWEVQLKRDREEAGYECVSGEWQRRYRHRQIVSLYRGWTDGYEIAFSVEPHSTRAEVALSPGSKLGQFFLWPLVGLPVIGFLLGGANTIFHFLPEIQLPLVALNVAVNGFLYMIVAFLPLLLLALLMRLVGLFPAPDEAQLRLLEETVRKEFGPKGGASGTETNRAEQSAAADRPRDSR